MPTDVPALTEFFNKNGMNRGPAEEMAKKFADAHNPDNSFVIKMYTFCNKMMNRQPAREMVLSWCAGPVSWKELEEDIPKFFAFFNKIHNRQPALELVERIIKPAGRVDFDELQKHFKEANKKQNRAPALEAALQACGC